MVPEGWEEQTLESVSAQKVTYGVVKPGDARTGGVPFVRGGDFPNGIIRVAELRTISQEISETYKRTLLKGGEILVSLVGYPGATAIVPKELEGANIARQAALVRPNQSIDRDYLFQFLRSDIGQKRMLSQTIGSAQQVINLKDLNALSIACPPLLEQRKIADILSTWDRAIEKTESLLANARTQKRALMQSLLTGKRRFPAFEGQPWKEVRLGDVLDMSYGKSPKEVFKDNGKYPVLGTGGETGRTDTALADGPVIIIGRKGTIDAPQWVDGKFWCIDTTYFCTTNDEHDLRWLFAWLRSINLRIYNEASGVPSLSRETLRAIKLMVPSKLEQSQIADVFVGIDVEIKTIGDQITKLRTEKKALMQQLLTGKRRVVI